MIYWSRRAAEYARDRRNERALLLEEIVRKVRSGEATDNAVCRLDALERVEVLHLAHYREKSREAFAKAAHDPDVPVNWNKTTDELATCSVSKAYQFTEGEPAPWRT